MMAAPTESMEVKQTLRPVAQTRIYVKKHRFPAESFL